MKLVRNLLTTAALSGALLVAAGAHAAAIVQDGDFTTPSGGGSYATYGPGGTMGPWTVTNTVDLIGGYWQAPSPGQGSVDLDGLYTAGGLSQSITLPHAGNYVLTFSLSGNPDNGAALKSVLASAGNASGTYGFTTGSNTHGNMMYQTVTMPFYASGTTTVLSFLSQDARDSAWGPVIGNVSISAVPEPATWAMMLIGFFGLGSLIRSRRHAVAIAA